MLASGRDLARLRFEQNINELLERRIRAFVYFFHLHGADRMLHNQHRVVRRAESLFLGFCQGIESVCN